MAVSHPFSIAFALALMAASGATATTASSQAPDFSLESMDGSTVRLSDFRGRIVVLNFWATWCPPCRYEIPVFTRAQKDYAEDVAFVGISMDEGGWDVVRPFARAFDVNYAIALDDGRVSEAYGGAEVLPSTFLIDRQGNIAVFAPGVMDEQELRQILEMMTEGDR